MNARRCSGKTKTTCCCMAGFSSMLLLAQRLQCVFVSVRVVNENGNEVVLIHFSLITIAVCSIFRNKNKCTQTINTLCETAKNNGKKRCKLHHKIFIKKIETDEGNQKCEMHLDRKNDDDV